MNRPPSPFSRDGMTLMELVVVLAVLAGLSGLLVPLLAGTIQTANDVSTERSLVNAQEALMDYWRDTKHITLDGITSVATESNRLSIEWLFENPVTGDATHDFSSQTQIGWRGPYLAGSTGDAVAAGYPLLIDAWNHEIVIQDVDPTASFRDVRIVSAGPDGVLTIGAATATAALTAAEVGDDVYVALSLR